jgi:hypothetical protein
MLMPGENCTVDLTLHKPMAVDKQYRFTLRNHDITIARGVVVDFLERASFKNMREMKEFVVKTEVADKEKEEGKIKDAVSA